MINTLMLNVKNYFAGLNRFNFVIGFILAVTAIFAYTGGAGLTPMATASFFIFGGVFIYKNFSNVDGAWVLDKRLFFAFGLVLVTILVSFFWTSNYYLTARFLANFLIFGAMLFSAKRLKKSEVVLFLVTISILNLGLAIWDILNYPSGNIIRLAGFVGYTNTMGIYSAVIGFAILNYINSFGSRLKWFLIFIAATNFFAAFMTLSRGAGVAVLVAAFLTIIFFYKKIDFKKAFKYGLVSIGISLVFVGSVYLLKNYVKQDNISFSRNDISVAETSGLRLQYFKTAFSIFKQNSFGIGPGNYREVMFKYLKNPTEQANDPHSFLMMLLAENGLFIVFWLYLLFEVIRNIFINRQNLGQAHIFYIFISMAFLLHSLADGDMSYPFSWLILGFLIGNTLHLKELSFKYVSYFKNIIVGVMLVFGFLGLISSYLLIKNLDFVGTYDELSVRDKRVLLAAKISPINASVWDNASSMALYKTLNAKNDIDRQKSAEDVFYRTGRSMALKGHYASQYSTRARVYSVLRDEANYRKSLETAIDLAPFNTYKERVALAYYYKNHNLYPELKNIVLGTYDLNKNYFGTAYAASDSELKTKTGAMVAMLQVLQAEAHNKKDTQTEVFVAGILKKFN